MSARIAKGQQAGLEGGEQSILSFEEFPHLALSRTYCVDSTVADSACSVTAYLGGVKGTYRTIGLSGAGRYKQCETQLETENHVSSIMSWAQAAGKATGVVSTNGITDASPAGAYAHVAYRGWYNDFEVVDDGADPELCDDIAEQLVRREPGRNLNVILAGGDLRPSVAVSLYRPNLQAGEISMTNLFLMPRTRGTASGPTELT